MKVVISTITVLVIANITTFYGDGDNKVWEWIWDCLKSLREEVKLHPDSGLSISQFLDKYNYTLETHEVTTEDGYILSLHRIPGRRGKLIILEEPKNNRTKPVVLLVHCLACSSMNWICQGPNNSLALLLADLDYDVWLMNTRGNSHSMKHQTLTPVNSSFWDFSFHEKGYYDTAASIDYILEHTTVDTITYIGHSQGTSDGLVLTSSRPEYNDKINLMVLMSPIAYMEHTSSPLVKLIQKYMSLLKLLANIFGVHGIPYIPQLGLLTDIVCNETSSLQALCILIMDLFAGFDAEQVDKYSLTVFLYHTPNGVSIKDIEHYTQVMTSGYFRKFDFGNAIANILHYGTAEPPSYDIRKITTPIAVYYAKNDFLASVTDVEKLIGELNVEIVDDYLIDFKEFNHLDFIIAKDVKKLLYDRIIQTIQKKTPNNV